MWKNCPSRDGLRPKPFRSGVPMDGCALLWHFFRRPPELNALQYLYKFSGGGVVHMSWGDALDFKSWIKTTQFKWWSHVKWLVECLSYLLLSPILVLTRFRLVLVCPCQSAGFANPGPGANWDAPCVWLGASTIRKWGWADAEDPVARSWNSKSYHLES